MLMNERMFVLAILWLALAAVVFGFAVSEMTRTGVLTAFLAWMGGIVTQLLLNRLTLQRDAREAEIRRNDNP
jgi:hypothetical protein